VALFRLKQFVAESKYGSAKVRAFIDMLAQALRAQQLD